MKNIYIILIIFTLLLIPNIVNASYKPTTVTDKEDLIYLIRYYNGSKSKVEDNTLYLQKDLLLGEKSIKFNLKEKLTIDINGYRIISKGNNPCIIINGDRKLLTIINSKNDTGYIKSSYNTIKVLSGNTILDNLRIISESKDYNGLYEIGGKVKLINNKIISKNNAINIKYGFLQAESGYYKGDNYGIKIDDGKVIINDGTFAGGYSGLNLNNYNSLHLKKGSFVTINKKKSPKEINTKMFQDLFVSRIIYGIGNN